MFRRRILNDEIAFRSSTGPRTSPSRRPRVRTCSIARPRRSPGGPASRTTRPNPCSDSGPGPGPGPQVLNSRCPLSFSNDSFCQCQTHPSPPYLPLSPGAIPCHPPPEPSLSVLHPCFLSLASSQLVLMYHAYFQCLAARGYSHSSRESVCVSSLLFVSPRNK